MQCTLYRLRGRRAVYRKLPSEPQLREGGGERVWRQEICRALTIHYWGWHYDGVNTKYDGDIEKPGSKLQVQTKWKSPGAHYYICGQLILHMIDNLEAKSQSKTRSQNLASRLSLKSHWPDRTPKYHWVSARCQKSRWIARGRTQGSSPCSSTTLSEEDVKPKFQIPRLVPVNYESDSIHYYAPLEVNWPHLYWQLTTTTMLMKRRKMDIILIQLRESLQVKPCIIKTTRSKINKFGGSTTRTLNSNWIFR